MTVSHLKNLLCLFQSLQGIFEYKIYSLIHNNDIKQKISYTKAVKKILEE